MDRPTKEQVEFELDFATQPMTTGTQAEWHMCAHRLAQEVRALQTIESAWSKVIKDLKEEDDSVRAELSACRAQLQLMTDAGNAAEARIVELREQNADIEFSSMKEMRAELDRVRQLGMDAVERECALREELEREQDLRRNIEHVANMHADQSDITTTRALESALETLARVEALLPVSCCAGTAHGDLVLAIHKALKGGGS